MKSSRMVSKCCRMDRKNGSDADPRVVLCSKSKHSRVSLRETVTEGLLLNGVDQRFCKMKHDLKRRLCSVTLRFTILLVTITKLSGL